MNFVAASMARPATASSMKSSLLLLLLCELLVELPLDHRLGRRWPLYPGGGAESSNSPAAEGVAAVAAARGSRTTVGAEGNPDDGDGEGKP